MSPHEQLASGYRVGHSGGLNPYLISKREGKTLWRLPGALAAPGAQLNVEVGVAGATLQRPGAGGLQGLRVRPGGADLRGRVPGTQWRMQRRGARQGLRRGDWRLLRRRLRARLQRLQLLAGHPPAADAELHGPGALPPSSTGQGCKFFLHSHTEPIIESSKDTRPGCSTRQDLSLKSLDPMAQHLCLAGPWLRAPCSALA